MAPSLICPPETAFIMKKTITLGLMSGTSLDGVDAVAVEVVGGIHGRDVDAVPLLVQQLARMPAHQVIVTEPFQQQLDGALAADLQQVAVAQPVVLLPTSGAYRRRLRAHAAV